jgi:ferredoxin
MAHSVDFAQHITVERVKRSLRSMNCYLLVANSRGISVWCGATGGYFTNHDVISAVKTSEIEDIVDHRKIILPQLAAAGIESGDIRQKTGWKVIWGPVYAKDISGFYQNGCKKSMEMREVGFPLTQRIEMAVMWAFPLSVIASLATALFWRELFLPVNGLIWALAFLLFGSFPLYSKWLGPKEGTGFSKFTAIFDLFRVAAVPGAERCVRCGACIVQCPFDALYFKSPDGRVIPPETIRKYKLNLTGRTPITFNWARVRLSTWPSAPCPAERRKRQSPP